MLKYLIAGTEALIVPCILIGILAAYIPARYGNRGRNILLACILASVPCAGVMSWYKNMTHLVDTGAWNQKIFTASIILWILFCVFDTKLLRKVTKELDSWIVPLAGGLMAFDLLFYALPDVLAYPYNFVLGGQAFFSTGFLYRLIGLILGILLCVVAGLAVCSAFSRIGLDQVGTLFKTAYLPVMLLHAAKILQTLYSRRKISGKWLFKIIKFTSNHASLFTYLTLAVVVLVPVVLWIRSFHVNEPYENPAQHRKIRAKWRSIRRWSTTLILTSLIAVLNMSVVKAYANRPVELSPVEECELRGDSLYIPFSQVEDGHLHRFAYTTDKGIAVRFLIIKKPNSSAYGIGLDACDICGETGYYERNGLVVCNRCDVVMNINTIGFKGGCNPKVIDYSIENGEIIVPTSTLIEHEKDFK